MEILECFVKYAPETPLQIGLTVCGVAVLAYHLLGGLFSRKMKLNGKVVLVTGASSGIGEALANEFAKAQCKIILAARRVDKLESLRLRLLEEYNISSGNIVAMRLDVADLDSISEFVQSALSKFGNVDILVNNAGICLADPVLNTEMKSYKRVFDVNFLGPVALTKEFLPSMIEKGGGSILTVSSLMGRAPLPYMSAYTASKHALQAFCDSLRAETSRKNIHVLVISPSFVKTEIDISKHRGDMSIEGKKSSGVQNGMSAATCAQSIVNALVRYESERFIGPIVDQLAPYIRTFLPGQYMRLISKVEESII